MFWSIIGIGAAILTTFSFVPQIVKVSRTKSVKDISPLTLLQFSVGVSLWIAYGLHLKNAIIVIANAVTLMTVIVLLTLYFRYNM